MDKTMQAKVYNEIENIDQFEEMLLLADEINTLLRAYIRKNRKNIEIKELLEDFKRADLEQT
jgi:hypothetical protein